jgi:hypothetical protein
MIARDHEPPPGPPMKMAVSKSLTLATVLVLELTILANAASRARHRSQPVHRTYSTRAAPVQGGGGYSSNPRTGEHEVLADKYRPVGW